MSPGAASGLEVKVTEGERCRRTLEVSAPAEFVDRERVAATRKYAARMKLKGFRKGRVPPSVIDKRFGRAIEEEAVERAVRKACDEAISTRELRPVDNVDVTEVRYRPGEPLTFKAIFDVWPEVPTGRLGGFRVERPPVEVPEGAADRIIERLRGEQAVWETAENGRPEAGNAVTVVMTRLDGDESDGDASREYDLVLGEGQALPDIEDAIRTLTIDGEGDFDVTFPEDFPDENRQGARHRVRIRLLSRRVPRLPEADDAFARSVGNFEDLDDLRGRVGEDLEREARSHAEAEVNNRLMRMVVEANPFEVPESMVERYTDVVLREAEEMEPEELEGLRKELRPASEFAVRRDLLVSRIAEEHDLHASSDEVGAQIEAVARERGEPVGRVRARLRKSGALDTLERRLTDAKLFRFLREQSEITDVS
ncbi:MAG: trigger factor [Gemmatimonadetes bacterium]|nr:trigger factor [Gemmatimonadota bacterium]MYA64739.1 trigger factor [Gemmatimonadota bacterium]MYB98054.1 trigger factor [Gemmatimonadota bacterium]MYH54189.1 trigger factor [Gemmatimonadota bacterium]MYI46323.1 trigger factor [Gemmatimonadota bacterium]